MLDLAEAQTLLLAEARPLPIERVLVSDALGRYLAEPLIARRTRPAADVSAMDGYAMRAADLPGPWQVIGESAAGHPFDRELEQKSAVRISTGALMPKGADMVLMQEDAARIA
jgi:molybdopterin molybdotransferase